MALAILLTACDVSSDQGAAAAISPGVESPLASASAPLIVQHSGCRSLNELPDPACTPGEANSADVTQGTLSTTICRSGYTSSGQRSDGRSVRPPVSYTDAWKLQGIAAYRYADTNPADYEEDHLIPLELGGDGYTPANLWPEPRSGPHPASAKDAVENQLHSLVCSNAVGLVAAQRAIAIDWQTAVAAVGGSAPIPQVPSTPATSSASTFPVTITVSVYGEVAASTLAGASCTARARLPSGNYSQAQGLQIAVVADAGGAVSWSYGTSTSTHKGTGTHFVTCRLGGLTSSAAAPFTV